MASSGTIAAPAIDVRLRPQSGHDTTLLMGRARIKSTAVLEAGDLTLRTIKNAVVTPYYTQAREGPPMQVYGSVALAGSLMNSVTFRVLRGSLSPTFGTCHMGTVIAGTVQVGFFLTGA